jgi:hypothetical protein
VREGGRSLRSLAVKAIDSQVFNNRESAIRNQQNPQSAIKQSALANPQSANRNCQSSIGIAVSSSSRRQRY